MALDFGLGVHNGHPVICDGVSASQVMSSIQENVIQDVEDVLDIFRIKWNKSGEDINPLIERIFTKNRGGFEEMFPDFFTEERTAQDFHSFLDEEAGRHEKVYNYLWNPIAEFGQKYLGAELNELPSFDTIGQLLDQVKYFPNKLQGNPRLPERYQKIHSGKVRETYQHPDNPDELIMIATDRISTHDVIHMGVIPGKGKALTKMSNFWFKEFARNDFTSDIPNQLVKNPNLPDDFPQELIESATVVKKLKALPIEAIVRGYLYGSVLNGDSKNNIPKYNPETGEIGTGEFIGKGLQKCSKLNEPRFTPSTKSDSGDVNVNFETMIASLESWLPANGYSDINARELAEQIKDYSLRMYEHANKVSQTKGMILGDTKFEFGLDENGKLTLIDEACTADSSRLWTADSVVEGQEPKSHDKQPTRDEVIKYWKNNADRSGKFEGEKGFKKYPVPLTDDVIIDGEGRYINMSEVFSEVA